MQTQSSEKPSTRKTWLNYYDKQSIKEELPQYTLYDYLFQNNQDYPDEIALSYFDTEIRFCDLFENIYKTAKAYLALGVSAGDIVTICSVTTPEIIYSFYAMDLIGATCNFVDPRTSIEGIREYIQEVQSKYVCVINAAYPKIRDAVLETSVAGIVVISPADSLNYIKRAAYWLTNNDKNKYASNCVQWEQFIRNGSAVTWKPEPYSPEHCAVIVHTGGTTGSPKGVMLSDDAFNALAFQYKGSCIAFKRQQKFLNVMPPFIAYGLACGVHMPLALGITCVIIPKLEPRKLASLVLKYKPAHMCGVPVHFQMLANDKRMQYADLSHFINIGSGGDAIAIGTEREINEFLLSHGSKYALTKGYGMTELCSTACTCMGNVNKPGSVGIPLIKNTISAFCPGTDQELGTGEKGELCITGPTIMLGYYGKPEETSNVLRKHSDGKVWVHTGDIGYVDEDGFVFVETRIKRMIIRHDGFKVFPNAIENVISTHPAVAACSVVAVRDKAQPQGDLPFAYMVLKKNVQESQKQIKAEIMELCHEKLPEYVQPSGYKFCDSLYYTPVGKVDYRRLEMESV